MRKGWPRCKGELAIILPFSRCWCFPLMTATSNKGSKGAPTTKRSFLHMYQQSQLSMRILWRAQLVRVETRQLRDLRLHEIDRRNNSSVVGAPCNMN
jgi:hypothetical protein